MIMAILAGLRRDAFNKFTVNFDLIALKMIFGVFALETSIVRDIAPVTRHFCRIQEQRLLLRLDGFIGVAIKMSHKQPESGFIHVHPSAETVIEMASSAIIVILERAGSLPLINRCLHLMTGDTGFVLKIAD